MKKMTTLFKKDPNDLGKVINEIAPENEWVFTDEGVRGTRKWDGTACAIIDGQLYKRYDAKKGKTLPPFAIPCQDPDPITGHWPHWVLCQHDNPADKYHFEAFNNLEIKEDGTYELCGPKFQGNPEGFDRHVLIKHGEFIILINCNVQDFHSFKSILQDLNIEGIVFHHPDGRMCKLRKSDYGLERSPS